MSDSTVSTEFTVTERAAAKIDQLLLEDGSSDALRVAVTGGGCSGFQYALGLDSLQDMAADDHTYRCGDVTVIIDDVSLDYLVGGTLDYDDGLMGKGFSVDNPNATGSCGCGQSFDAPEAPCRS
jgi:iron-sulfur cluster insertion protein